MRLSVLPLAALPLAARAATPAEVADTCADVAEAACGDSHAAARDLRAAVESVLAAPSEAGLPAAPVPYRQTEAFRFGSPILDDREGRVSAWPPDEGLMDHVSSGPFASDDDPAPALDVIGNPRPRVGGAEVDASVIDAALIAEPPNEAEGIEGNVARGRQAAEVLLRGQDLGGTGPGAGERPWTDCARGAARTGGNRDRRADDLRAAAARLAEDLAVMAGAWAEGAPARKAVTAGPEAGPRAMLTGMGPPGYGEPAGERMWLGLPLDDPEAAGPDASPGAVFP